MISYFGKHPTAANLLMAVLMIAGALSVPRLRRETLPDFSPREVQIRVLYPGADAAEVEEAVCQRIEDALDGVRFVAELRSEAREGLCLVTVEQQDGPDFVTFKDEIETEVQAIDDFPPDIEEPLITQLHTTEMVLAVLVSGPMDAPDLKAYCEDLKERLQTLSGVSLVTIGGFSDHQLRIELPAESLMRHNMSVADVADIVARQSVDLPAGTVETRQRDILVRFVDERTTVQSLEDLVIRAAPGGAELRLRDIGRVVDRFEFSEDKIVMNGGRAALLNIEKTKNQDTLNVASSVKAFIADERLRQPAVDLRVTQDQSRLVSDRLRMLISNGAQGMVLVFLVMWLFFNGKLSFWVAMSLPVSFLGAFFLVPMLGLTINMLTMVGLLLGIGLLMDDGIVIAENIATHRARGKEPLRAAVDGVREVGGGVLSSFLTTVCVLGPLAALDGNIGKVLKVVPMIVILIMAVSLIEAFLILPAHLEHALRGTAQGQRGIRQRIDGIVEWVRERVLGRTVDAVMRLRYLWIGFLMAVLLMAVALGVGRVIRFEALPELDGDVIVARLLMPPGTPLPHTEAAVQRITDGLQRVNAHFADDQPDGEALVQTVYVRFNHNEDAFEAGAHVATVYADLLAAEVRSARLDHVLQTWREEVGVLPDALSVVYAEPALGPAGRSIEIRLHGAALQDLLDEAVALKAWMGNFKGVYNLAEDLRPGKPELKLRLREGALGRGIDAAMVARQLRAAYFGATAHEIQVGSESYEIVATLDATDQNSLADLDHFYCTLPNGQQVPLSAVTEVQRSVGWSRIARVDNERTVTLRGEVDSRQTNTMQIIQEFEQAYLPELQARRPHIGVTYEGEVHEASVTQASMQRAMLVGMIGVFVLLSFHFRSYIEPLIVMAAIPMAFVGVIGGHLLLGMDLSLPSVLGFASLAGIVVNDSILLVLFLKKGRAEGRDLIAAATQASRQRFRAIIITSLTTIAGLSPLLFERSLQAQILIPLAVSIVFGLLASTVLVLLVIPCMYVILAENGLAGAVDTTTEPASAKTVHPA